MKPSQLKVLPMTLSALLTATVANAASLNLTCRTFDQQNAPVVQLKELAPCETAIVVIDMYDAHWCKTHTKRLSELAHKMNPVLDAARQLGLQVVFSPSDVADFYKNDARRQAVLKMTHHAKPPAKPFDPPLPPWARTGGCECGPQRPCQSQKVWTRQNVALTIKDGDLIVNGNDNHELYNVCRAKGIKTLLYMGTAANKSVSWTRPVSMRQMSRLGFDCILVRDMTLALTGQGYDPDRKKTLGWFGPLYADEVVFNHLDRYFAASALSVDLLQSAGKVKPVFTPEQVQAYKPKGPTKCFRQLCYDYNWCGMSMDDLPKKFSKADPVEMAEFSKRCNLDAALLLAIPHHGYCTYETRVGKKFPAMKGDWYGRVIEEHHKRGISALGYITLNWNWKYMREHYQQEYVHREPMSSGEFKRGAPYENTMMCFNAPGYIDLVEAYTREVMTNYPVDGMRYDVLWTKKKCLCDGCKALYREMYGEELTTWEGIDERRWKEFDLETLRRPVLRLQRVVKSIKPSVEFWQNQINLNMESDVNVGRIEDIAYIEFGAPGHLLILNGVLDKQGIIIGQTLKSPIRRLIMALGARCYQYASKNEMDQLTAVPRPEKSDWFYNDLAPFFAMVRDVQPYLDGAIPVTHAAGVYSEATRYRYKGFGRKHYRNLCERLTLKCIDESLPLKWVNVLDLEQKDLNAYSVLVLPETSGLTPTQLDRLRHYVHDGGQLLLAGDTLRHDQDGRQRQDFALAQEMGLTWKKVDSPAKAGWAWRNTQFDGEKASLTVQKPGQQLISLWHRDPGAPVDRIYLTQSPEFLANDETVQAALAADRGLCWEAEDTLKNIARGGGRWNVHTQLDGYSGNGYVVCDGGSIIDDPNLVAANAAEIRYQVTLPDPGKWYIWIRQQSPDNLLSASTTQGIGHDSVHVGLDGKAVASINFDTEGWQEHPEDLLRTKWQVVDRWDAGDLTETLSLGDVAVTQPTTGRTLLALTGQAGTLPLLHVNNLGKGRLAYLATADCPALTLQVVRWLAQGMPALTEPADKQVVVTRQETQDRWVLHLLSQGDYSVQLTDKFISARRVVEQYPATGWSYQTRKNPKGLEIKVSGGGDDRLLILR